MWPFDPLVRIWLAHFAEPVVERPHVWSDDGTVVLVREHDAWGGAIALTDSDASFGLRLVEVRITDGAITLTYQGEARADCTVVAIATMATQPLQKVYELTPQGYLAGDRAEVELKLHIDGIG